VNGCMIIAGTFIGSLYDCIFALKYILHLLHRRINTFGKKVKVGNDNYHAIREYSDTLKNIYADNFLSSQEYDDYIRTSGVKSIGYTKFKEGALSCPCVKEPTMRACVDEIETSFSELTYALRQISTRYAQRCDCPYHTAENVMKAKYGKGK
jgi:hypothetical protein